MTAAHRPSRSLTRPVSLLFSLWDILKKQHGGYGEESENLPNNPFGSLQDLLLRRGQGVRQGRGGGERGDACVRGEGSGSGLR